MKKVKETGIFIDNPKREKPKTVRTPGNIAAVAESVCEALSTSIHRRSKQLNTSETSLRRILQRTKVEQYMCLYSNSNAIFLQTTIFVL